MRPETIRVHAALVSVSLIYGYFYVAVKLLLKSLALPELIFLRFVLAAIAVILIDRLVLKNPIPDREDWPKIAILGLLGVFLVQILVVWGVHQTTAFHSALIMATIPMLTLLFSVITGRERFHIRKALGLLVGFAGVAILLFFSHQPSSLLPNTYLWGDLIILFNAAAFACYLLGSQQMLRKYSAFPLMAYGYVVSAPLFASLFLGFHWGRGNLDSLAFISRMSLSDWSLIGYVVLFASIGSYTLNNYALKRVSPSVVAVYIFIQPIISAATGYYLLGEPFTWPMALSAMVTFAGVLLATTTRHRVGIFQETNTAQEPAMLNPSAASSEEEKAG